MYIGYFQITKAILKVFFFKQIFRFFWERVGGGSFIFNFNSDKSVNLAQVWNNPPASSLWVNFSV